VAVALGEPIKRGARESSPESGKREGVSGRRTNRTLPSARTITATAVAGPSQRGLRSQVTEETSLKKASNGPRRKQLSFLIVRSGSPHWTISATTQPRRLTLHAPSDERCRFDGDDVGVGVHLVRWRVVHTLVQAYRRRVSCSDTPLAIEVLVNPGDLFVSPVDLLPTL
jgi:hypothetical protein